jgi:two-component system, sensor histidine kinase and response regulator
MALSLGWTVDTAGSGAEALQRINYRADRGEPPYQAIFMDWLMPDMDGWEATQRIRQLHLKVQAPVVVMVTAHGREMLAQRSEAEHTSLDGFLVKPITASMLNEAIQNAMEHLRNPTRVTTTKAAQAKPLAGLRLLVVEDNLINQQVARELLSAEGASIDIAGNGQLGVDAVAAANPQYDAVLMDIQMPVMDGYTAAVTIRNELGLHTLPIIAMTANAMASDREACLAAGMDDHIGKPFDVPQLVALLCRHTGHSPDVAAPTNPAVDVAPHNATVDIEARLPVGAIDVSGALALLGDNVQLYGQIAQAYLAEIAAMPGQMQDLLQRGELTEASRVLHTIKGLSLTVGAKQLSAVCRTGELQVKQALTDSMAPDTSSLQSALQESIIATTEALQSALRTLIPAATAAQATASTSVPSLDVPALLADLQTLERLLAESDMRALEHHTALRAAYAGATGARLDDLSAALGAFDFAQGVVQCRDLIREFSTYN